LIRLDEISTVFSDSAIASAAKRVGVQLDVAALECLASAVRAHMREFAVAARRPTANTVRREMEALAQALDATDGTNGRAYDSVKKAWAELSNDARQMLERRLDIMRQAARRRLESWEELAALRGGHLLLPPPDSGCASLELPAVTDLEDAERRDHAFDVISRAVITGRGPEGLRVHAPAPTRAEPRREAERDLVLKLIVAWSLAAGRKVTTTGRHNCHYRKRSIVILVAELLRLARVPVPANHEGEHDHDRQGLAVAIMNGFAAIRRRRLTEDALRQELQELRLKHDLVDETRRQLELGKAKVKRVPAGAEPDLDPREPAIIEFEDVGRICFYLPPFGWRTLAVKPFARDRIMRLAEQLAAQNVRSQRVRQRLQMRRAMGKTDG
jgi:hypothetical protein